MEFSISARELRTALARVGDVVEKKTTMPVLSHVLVQARAGGVTVTGFDLDIGATSEHAAEVVNEGSFLLQAKLLKELVAQMPEDTVRLKKLRNKVELTSGSASFSLIAVDATDYPRLPAPPAASFVGVSGVGLLELIRHVTHAMSNDETRVQLNGAFLQPQKGGTVRLVATDGHRLAMLERPLEGETGPLKVKGEGALLPRKAVLLLKRLLEDAPEVGVELALTDNMVWFRRPGFTLFARCLESQFPEYQRVVPKSLGDERKVSIGRQRLIDALKRMALVSGDDDRVVVTLSPGKVVLRSSHHDKGEAHEELEVAYSGPGVTVGFNARYLMEAMAPVGFDEVVMDLNDEHSPAVLRVPQDDSLVLVVMPMRVS